MRPGELSWPWLPLPGGAVFLALHEGWDAGLNVAMRQVWEASGGYKTGHDDCKVGQSGAVVRWV